MDNKTIGISSLIALGFILSSMIVPTFFDKPTYYCEDESSIMECADLSGGSHTRCYLNPEKNSWDYCKTGWIEITKDTIIQEEPSLETDLKPAKGTYLCSPIKCERIN